MTASLNRRQRPNCFAAGIRRIHAARPLEFATTARPLLFFLCRAHHCLIRSRHRPKIILQAIEKAEQHLRRSIMSSIAHLWRRTSTAGTATKRKSTMSPTAPSITRVRSGGAPSASTLAMNSTAPARNTIILFALRQVTEVINDCVSRAQSRPSQWPPNRPTARRR